ncbi:outer membrane lipoprotein carrier protein LolA [Lewinella sp. LCG006]|uniref:LolA family protein n=1 Tax=Lewinella sp. LCG006 TaxID=3231911 RepID=UPI00346166A6
MKHIFLLCALSLGFFMGNAQNKAVEDITADEIIATYLENIGGKDNWKALTAMRMEGKMAQMGMEFPGVVMQVPPNKQRIEVNIQGQQMIQAYDGETAWWINPFMGGADAQPMPAEMASEFTKEKFEDDFIDYAEKGHTVELLGEAEVDGVMTYEVKLTKKDGSEEFHYFDPEYMVPIMQKTILSEGQMKGQAVENYLSDYQEFEGLMIPTYIESKLGGATQFSMTVTKVELNPELDETLFAYPKGK